MINQINQIRAIVRNIILTANYCNVAKVCQDTEKIFLNYPYFYPISEQKPTQTGKVGILVLIGNVTIYNKKNKKHEQVKIKITFPREYPRQRCYVALPNPDQNMYNRNPYYQKNGLANYDRNPLDQKCYLYFKTPELKNWNERSDILKLILEIQQRLDQQFPFEKVFIATNRSESSAGFNKGIQNQYLSNQYNQSQTLREEIQSTQNEYMEIEGDFYLLTKKRIEMNFKCELDKITEYQLVHKTKQLQKYIAQIKKMTEECEKVVLNHSTMDDFIECNEQTKKRIQLISEKEALEQCHLFLKQQLKNGIQLSALRQPLKKLYEQMFINQFHINQI